MKEILNKLIDSGFDAYIVGGYIRDFLLGKESFDIDICTNASIDNIIKIFNKEGVSYKKYFSYHLVKGLYNYDITTFRKELAYENNKPTKVVGVNDLYTDLLRRDFTINTLALDKDNNLIDLLGSRKDIDNKLIKTVGNTYDKFIEDKTRILRAIRFYVTLDFELDNEIIEFIKEKGYLIKELNSEYKKSELNKIFECNPLRFFNFMEKYNLKECFDITYDKIVDTHSYYGVWAQINSNYTFTKDERIIINAINKLVNKGDITSYDIYKNGELVSLNASIILNKDISWLIKSLPIHSVFDIDINIDDLMKYKDKYSINKIMNEIEENIINNNIKNNKSDIIKYIEGEYHE